MGLAAWKMELQCDGAVHMEEVNLDFTNTVDAWRAGELLVGDLEGPAEMRGGSGGWQSPVLQGMGATGRWSVCERELLMLTD